MKWKDWCFMFLVIILVVVVALLPIVWPSGSYLEALQGW